MLNIVFDDGDECEYMLNDAEVDVVSDTQVIAKFWHWNDERDEKFHVTCTFNKGKDSAFHDDQAGDAYAEGMMTYAGNFLVKNGVLLEYNGMGGDVVIPDGVTSIGEWAFESCKDLTSVTIPNSVTNIGEGAFVVCTGLTSLTIPNGVKNIAKEAFTECSGLTSVEISASVTHIGDEAFGCCTSLKDFVVDANNPSFSVRNGLLCNKTGNTIIACPGAFTEVTIPAGVTKFGVGAFEGGLLTSLTIPDGVTALPKFMFSFCYELRTVVLPASLVSLGDYVFEECSGLSSMAIPGSVARIGEGTFYGTSLSTVYVAKGDTDRVKALLGDSGFDVSGITFIEDEGLSPATSGYEVIEATDIVAPYEAPKAVTLQGVASDGGKVVGIVELKLGKVNAKKKASKVSGSVTTLDGKKHAIKAFTLTEIDGTAPKVVALEVKDIGTMSVTIGGTQFAGFLGDYHVQSAVVGGNWTRAGARVYVDVSGGRGATALPEGTIEDLLPDGEPVVASGGKWKFAKAANVKWAKPKKGAALPERYDEASGKGLVVDTSAGKTNLSGLKLTYTPKKGTFKGSFKIYALEGAGKATKLKKYTVNVSGVVAGGVGYGTATCKAPAVSWVVKVE